MQSENASSQMCILHITHSNAARLCWRCAPAQAERGAEQGHRAKAGLLNIMNRSSQSKDGFTDLALPG